MINQNFINNFNKFYSTLHGKIALVVIAASLIFAAVNLMFSLSAGASDSAECSDNRMTVYSDFTKSVKADVKTASIDMQHPEKRFVALDFTIYPIDADVQIVTFETIRLAEIIPASDSAYKTFAGCLTAIEFIKPETKTGLRVYYTLETYKYTSSGRELVESRIVSTDVNMEKSYSWLTPFDLNFGA